MKCPESKWTTDAVGGGAKAKGGLRRLEDNEWNSAKLLMHRGSSVVNVE